MSIAAVRQVLWTDSSDEVIHPAALPRDVRQSSGSSSMAAQTSVAALNQIPPIPRLNLQKVHDANNLYCPRVGLGCWVFGKLDGGDIVWFWIGPHSEYSRLI